MRIVKLTFPAVVHSVLIGLGMDETLRLNLFSLGGPDTRSRRVQTTFFDAAGKVVKRSEVDIAGRT
jgi:hypothetical protein